MHKYFSLLIFFALFFNCSTDKKKQENFSIIPFPSKVVAKEGFSNVSKITVSNKNVLAIKQLYSWLTGLTFFEGSVTSGTENVRMSIDKTLPAAAYFLTINKDDIHIKYKTVEGLRNAISTLLQLHDLNEGKFPLCSIEDQARFSYRGMHLDVSRHFFQVEELKKFIDYLAFYKYNKFHWHLTDDQGWRIEIKQYPKLQDIAAFRKETLVGHYNDQPHQFDGKRYGGFYTQDQAREIVAYAHARGVEVIPEIEMPGHSSAALSAYPELACSEGPFAAATKWGVFSDVFCPTEQTFTFLENVIDEIIPIFPSEYIHIGGDECPKTAWKKSAFCQKLIKQQGLVDEHGLQSYFIQRMEEYINSKGKKIIGWDEILEGGLAPNATVMSWRGEQGGIDAAMQDHPVIMTPTTYCYFDYYQSDHEDEPLAIGGLIPYEKVYHYEIIPEELPEEKHNYILGGQGNIWTEYLPTFDLVEYMGLTRMATLSEVLWKSSDQKDFSRFNRNLFQHIQYWNDKGVRMANHMNDVVATIDVKPGKGVFITPRSKFAEAKKYYQSPDVDDFKVQTSESVACDVDGTYRFYHEFNGKKGKDCIVEFKSHLGNQASIALSNPPHEKYSGNGGQSLINGVMGPSDRYGGYEWLGFLGLDLVAAIDLQNQHKLNSIKFKFFKGEGQWIYLPASIQVSGSTDGNTYDLIASTDNITSDGKIANIELLIDKKSYRYLKINIENYGIIPAERQGGGNKSWLFIDEIIIQ